MIAMLALRAGASMKVAHTIFASAVICAIRFIHGFNSDQFSQGLSLPGLSSPGLSPQ
jgi:hypothetical protein